MTDQQAFLINKTIPVGTPVLPSLKEKMHSFHVAQQQKVYKAWINSCYNVENLFKVVN